MIIVFNGTMTINKGKLVCDEIMFQIKKYGVNGITGITKCL